MWKSFYENAELMELPLFSMVLFMLTFTAAVWLAFKHAKPQDQRALMPLSDSGEGSAP